MNRKAILETALTHYDHEQSCYVTQSTLSDRVVGCGSSQTMAFNTFKELLNGCYIAQLEGKLVTGTGRRGRPKKNYDNLHVQISKEVMEQIELTAKKLNIGKGEAVMYLIASGFNAHRGARY